MQSKSTKVFFTFFLFLWISHSKAFAKEDNDEVLFTYCEPIDAIAAYEFQVRLDIAPFQYPAWIPAVSRYLFDDFVSACDDELKVSKLTVKQSIFEEKSWYLTQLDGTPLPEDTIQDPVYGSNCPIRTRETQKIEDLELGKIEITSSLKINQVDAVTFKIPSVKGISESLDCDVYADYDKATYKAKVKDLEKVPVYETFGDVVAIFPLAKAFFEMPYDTSLPLRDHYFTHRIDFDDVEFDEVKFECSLDFRFHNRDSALHLLNPYFGEFSCSLERGEVEDEDKNPEKAFGKLREAFTVFYETTDWKEPPMVVV